MSQSKLARLKEEGAAKLLIWLAARASRNKSWLDRTCRGLVGWVLREDPQNAFMRDPVIDEDEGFDPDELERYQRGEIDGA